MKIGILAYGSLRDCPGEEICSNLEERITGVKTPFPVEFCRESKKRKGAPTLVPHDPGSPVKAEVLVLKEGILLEMAKAMLWRREIGERDTSKKYIESLEPSKTKVRIKERPNFAGVPIVLYTDFDEKGKISEVSAEKLADLAFKSVKNNAPSGQDGITYLMNAIKKGTITPLTRSYEQEILRRTGATSLQEALQIAKGDSP